MDEYINLFKHMPQGWDSFDADPPSEIAITLTKEICCKFKSEIKDFPRPFSDGGIRIDFLSGIHLDIYNDGEIIYANKEQFLEIKDLNTLYEILNKNN